jgi:hypothetical protein
MKNCYKCKTEKEKNEFSKNKSQKDGLNNICKSCKKEYNDINKQHNTEINKQWRLNNLEKKKEYDKRWRCENKEKHLEYYRMYFKNKYDNDPSFRISMILRSSINNYLKNKDISINSQKLLGCTANEWKIHLENQFLPEMTWENQSKIWEIDHIKPLFSFDLTDPIQQMHAFHYTNTRPLFINTKIAESLGYKGYIGNQNRSKSI